MLTVEHEKPFAVEIYYSAEDSGELTIVGEKENVLSLNALSLGRIYLNLLALRFSTSPKDIGSPTLTPPVINYPPP